MQCILTIDTYVLLLYFTSRIHSREIHMGTISILSKVVFWNIWGHRCPDEVHEYLSQHREVEIFCLTEVLHCEVPGDCSLVYTNQDPDGSGEPPTTIDGLQRLRWDFGDRYDVHYVAPTYRTWICTKTGMKFSNIGFGSALMCCKSLCVIATGHEITGTEENPETARVLQWVVYEKCGEKYLLAHLHGMWIDGNSKGDDPRRLKQSKEVLDRLTLLSSQYEVSKIVFGGDLNLALDTEALRLLETGYDGSIALCNHIKEWGIENTRTPWYRRYNDPTAVRHADYVMSTPEVSMTTVRVDTDCLGSDHAPIYCSFC